MKYCGCLPLRDICPYMRSSGVREQPWVHEHPAHPDEEGRGPLHHPETAGERLLSHGSFELKSNFKATSDLRENPLVTVLGSHAAMTCQIVVGSIQLWSVWFKRNVQHLNQVFMSDPVNWRLLEQVMKHTESCVASIGHFDNHTCWQVIPFHLVLGAWTLVLGT